MMAARRISELSAEPLRPLGVFTSSWTWPFFMRSTRLGRLSPSLETGIVSIPFSLRNVCVPSVAMMRKPISRKRRAGSMAAFLSRSAMVNSTVPASGRVVWVASWALKKARPKE